MGEGEVVNPEEEQRVMDISIKELSTKLEEFAKARDWEKFHSPRNLLLAMVLNFPLNSSYFLNRKSCSFHQITMPNS